MWPIHDLVVTEMMAWILPTHMWTHIIRFALVLSVMWGGTLWLLLRQGLSKSRPEEDPVFMILFCGLVGAISLAWIYWYHHSVLFAIGKPWMNPQIPAFNRKEMHVPLRLFDSIEKARRAACLPHMVAYNSTPKLAEKDPSTITSTDYLSPNVLLLDSIGTWQFQLLSSVEDGLALVQRETTHMQGNDSGDKWSTTQVPGHWMLQGFNDIPIYTNKKYPFPANPPIVPRENPTGVYKLLVELPDDWNHAKDQEYSIMLHGVESACFVYWNGHLLGFFKDSRLPSEFQIPSELSSHGTTAVLHLVVARWSDGSYMEDQDHWWMAGVHRSIELIRRPARADILDYRVLATASRTLSVAVRLRHNPSASTSILTVKLYDDIQITPDGDRWSPAQDELWSQSKQVESSSTMPTTFLLESSTIPQVQLWTAETPNLYTLLLVQSDASTGKILQAESCRVGFRSIEIRGDGILRVNGERVTICGINRHEHDPDHGKVVSLERMKQDIVILKQNNFNAIRTSHYPTHSSFYRLCDFYGMYVCDEANVETDGMKPMGRLANDWGWEQTFVSRVQRMVQRDWNHACICFWSLGNESGRGKNLVKARKAVLDMDTSRPVCYEGGGSWAEGVGKTELTDIICPMYPDAHLTESLALCNNDDRPIILCEYSHSMNNSNGNLHLYWNVFWNPYYPRAQGGFIWDMIDQGLRKLDEKGRVFFAYGGDFGDLINDRQFCINGMFSPDREPHPSVSEIKYLQQPAAVTLPNAHLNLVIKVPDSSKRIPAVVPDSLKEQCHIQLKVVNRYAFSDLSHLVWKWKIILEFHPNADLHGFATLVDETLSIDCSSILHNLFDLAPPMVIGDVFLNIEGVLLSDQSWANAGHRVVSEQLPMKLLYESLSLQHHPLSKSMSRSSLAVVEDSSSIYVSNDMSRPSVVVIDKKTGGINAIKLDGRNILHGHGIQPNFTRASTDNDRGGMELVLDFLHLNWAKSLIRGISKKLFSYEMHWRDNGVSQDAPPSSTCTERKITTLGDSVQIEMTCSIRGASGNSILTATHVYNIFPNCTLRADVKVTPSDCIRGIPSLPRVGLSFGLHPAFHRVKYFGRGPHENYVDRKSGAQIGTWSTSPSKMGFDYIVPSENGSRSDCRWASFESDIGGLIVSADSNCELFSFSALLHTNHELHTASHTNDLDQRKDGEHPIFVNIDNRCMGLGGDVSWFPCVYSDFLVKATEHSYSIWFQLLHPGEFSEEAVSKRSVEKKGSGNQPKI